ncbi:MAG: sulfotransferase family protein [Microcoleaceae cyanobacterium]
MNTDFAQPLFILASPRSFTSVLCGMLGQHPQAYGVAELSIFASETLQEFTDRMQGLFQYNMHGLLRVVMQLYAGEQTLASLEMARRWVATRGDRTTGEVYQELCQKVASRRIIDKSPIYSTKREIMNRIYRNFPDAYYLHLVRHPRTQGQSMMNFADGNLTIFGNSVDYSTHPPTVDPQYWWYTMQCNILDFLDTVPSEQQMRLKGEDLLSDPKSYFEKICGWLNLDWNDEAFAAMLNPQDSPYACFGPYGSHAGNDPNFMQSAKFKQREIPSSQLAGDLPWRSDGKGFIPDVIQLAQTLGYE